MSNPDGGRKPRGWLARGIESCKNIIDVDTLWRLARITGSAFIFSVTYAISVLSSHVEALVTRINALFGPRLRLHNGHEKRRNPRTCVLCGGPMRPDRRPPRDVRRADGTVRRLPEEVMDWHRCGRCGLSQVGVKAR